MSGPRVVTFYSFKGGVGRTLALLDVAVILARAGQRVVAVDMDLEAPGFHRYPALGSLESERLGVSDYVLERLVGSELSVLPYVHRVDDITGVGERLFVVTAGSRARSLAEGIAGIYAAPLADHALVFQLFVARLREELQPDFVLFDSRTGLAEIAAVCTVDLADVIVALTGINPQGVDGLAEVVRRIRHHPARRQPPLFFLAYSPVPRLDDIEIPDAWTRLDPTKSGSFRPEVLDHPLATRISEAHDRLWNSAIAGSQEEERELRQRFPEVPEYERLHLLEYDPLIPLVGEDDFDRSSPLRDAHRKLARSVGLTNGGDLFPELRPGAEQGSWLERITSLHHAVDQRR